MEGHKKGVYIHLIGFREHSQSQKFKAMVLTSQRGGGGGGDPLLKKKRATSAIWRIFAELNNPKRALSKMNLSSTTSMEVSMF